MSVNIAIVDDDESILDAVKLVLEDEGWRVRTYATGEEFLADFDRHTPNCLILDPNLPGVSGAEVARSVVDGSGQIPIIGLTARPTGPVSTELVNAGAHVILTKPVTTEELVDQIQRAVGSVGDGQ